jgi:hypothetical protein
MYIITDLYEELFKKDKGIAPANVKEGIEIITQEN